MRVDSRQIFQDGEDVPSRERTSNIPVTDTIHFYVSGSGEKFTIIRDYANKIIQVKFLAHCKTHSK